MTERFLQKEDNAFMFDTVSGKVFRIDAPDKMVEIASPDSAAWIISNSSIVDREEAMRVASVP